MGTAQAIPEGAGREEGTAPPGEVRVELAEGYLLRDFETVLEDVARRSGDLLTEEERARGEAFRGLPAAARHLWVRMLTRQGPWFRADGLRYAEVPDVAGALEALEGAGFCGRSAPLPARVGLLRRDERVHWLRTFGAPAPAREGVEALGARLEALGGPLRGPLSEALRPAAPLGRDWARLLLLLFFGNAGQGLSDFVLEGLGRVRYEAYALDPRERILQTRADADLLLRLEDARAELEGAPDLEGLTARLVALEAGPALRLQRRFHGLLDEVGLAWERRGDPDRALACYRLSARPPARERTARILLARGEGEAATALALAMAGDPRDVSEVRFAERHLRRAAKREAAAAAWVEAHPPAPDLPEVRLELARLPGRTVEGAVVDHLRALGLEAWHVENGLWNACFGLAFWEALFAPVPGAFQHRFQAAPADLWSPDFHARRRPLLEGRLEALARPGALVREILGTFERKAGIANVFVNWKGLDGAFLARALEALPPDLVCSVLEAMARHPRGWRSGFPDLLVLDGAHVRLWEVKGPGDALRPEQERWLRHFLARGADAAVARVRWREGA